MLRKLRNERKRKIIELEDQNEMLESQVSILKNKKFSWENLEDRKSRLERREEELKNLDKEINLKRRHRKDILDAREDHLNNLEENLEDRINEEVERATEYHKKQTELFRDAYEDVSKNYNRLLTDLTKVLLERGNVDDKKLLNTIEKVASSIQAPDVKVIGTDRGNVCCKSC